MTAIETGSRPKKTELIQARVDPDTRKLLRRESVTRDIPESDIVRRALKAYFAPAPKVAS